jgi:hypothetical protein
VSETASQLLGDLQLSRASYKLNSPLAMLRTMKDNEAKKVRSLPPDFFVVMRSTTYRVESSIRTSILVPSDQLTSISALFGKVTVSVDPRSTVCPLIVTVRTVPVGLAGYELEPLTKTSSYDTLVVTRTVPRFSSELFVSGTCFLSSREL